MAAAISAKSNQASESRKSVARINKQRIKKRKSIGKQRHEIIRRAWRKAIMAKKSASKKRKKRRQRHGENSVEKA